MRKREETIILSEKQIKQVIKEFKKILKNKTTDNVTLCSYSGSGIGYEDTIEYVLDNGIQVEINITDFDLW